LVVCAGGRTEEILRVDYRTTQKEMQIGHSFAILSSGFFEPARFLELQSSQIPHRKNADFSGNSTFWKRHHFFAAHKKMKIQILRN
jgi:hypothetical protein